MKETTKNKIRGVVQLYVSLYPKEYQEFLKAIRIKKANQKDEYARVKGSDAIERLLYEIPEVLFNLLLIKLEVGEQEELEALEGATWFAKTFKQFRIPEKV